MEDIIILCPVCSELLEEPVTLPCTHELCLDCFRNSIEAGNLHCPLCRHRISTWARRRVSDPVNKERKEQLQQLYAQFGSIESLRLVASLQQEQEDKRQGNIEGGISDDQDFYKERRERELSDQREAFHLQEQEELEAKKIRKQVEEDEKLAYEISKEMEKSDPIVKNTTKSTNSSISGSVKKGKKKDSEPKLTLHNWFTVIPK